MSRPIPQGIEVLVLKAAIDPDFKQILLQRRTAAAEPSGWNSRRPRRRCLPPSPPRSLKQSLPVPPCRRSTAGRSLARPPPPCWRHCGCWPDHGQDGKVLRPAGFVSPAPTSPKTRRWQERVIEVIADADGRGGVREMQAGRRLTLAQVLKANAVGPGRDCVEPRKGVRCRSPPADFKTVRPPGHGDRHVSKRRSRTSLRRRRAATLPAAGPPAAGFCRGISPGLINVSRSLSPWPTSPSST